MPLDPHAKRLLERLAATNPPSARSLTIGARRSALQQLLAFAGLREEVECVENRTLPAREAPLPVRVYTPTGAPREPLPALIYFHGGGLVAGSLDSHDAICRSLTNASACRLISVDYRLAPEHPFPTALADGYAALAWVAAPPRELGIDAELARVGSHPGQRRVAVREGRRKRMLGGQAVVDGNQPTGAGVGEGAADRVVRIETAGDEPTAVEVDERGQRLARRARGRVHPHRQRGLRRGQGAILHARHFLAQAGESEQLLQRAAARADRQAASARGIGGGEPLQQALGVGVEWHVASSKGARSVRSITARARRAPSPASARARARGRRTARRPGGPCQRRRSRCARWHRLRPSGPRSRRTGRDGS